MEKTTWFEVYEFVDNDLIKGTRTIADFNTLAEAKKFIWEQQFKNSKNLFIDEWIKNEDGSLVPQKHASITSYSSERMNSMGLCGIVSHPQDLTDKYNILLDKIGVEGMLMQFERFINTEELNDLINQTEDNLIENLNIKN